MRSPRLISRALVAVSGCLNIAFPCCIHASCMMHSCNRLSDRLILVFLTLRLAVDKLQDEAVKSKPSVSYLSKNRKEGSSSMPLPVTLSRALLIAINCSLGLAFYLPGVSQDWLSRTSLRLRETAHTSKNSQTAPQDYKEGDRIDVQVNSLSPMLTSNIVSAQSSRVNERASANDFLCSPSSLEITHQPLVRLVKCAEV
jgi:hypothetical protein